MFLRTQKLPAGFLAIFALFVCFSLFSQIQGQTGKKSAKPAVKKDKSTKSTAKSTKSTAKSTKSSAKSTKSTAKSSAQPTKSTPKKPDDRKSGKNTTSKNDKSKARTTDKTAKSQEKNSKGSKPTKAELARQAQQKRIEAEREAVIRKAEEARRQAALAEQRRREQAAREARERQLAFERGLRTETTENIANDDPEGEDLEVRRAAVDALNGHAGTVVVMEPQTGKILSIVNQDWAIRRSFKPCSTIKLVTGIAGLNEKVIDSGGNIETRRFPMNLDDALAHSNNSYFQTVGAGIGSERMISYARALGLGQPTGINSEREAAGKLPAGNRNARIYSHGDDFEVTPLQLAVLVSAISNGGKIVVPQIPKTKFDKTDFRGFTRGEVVNVPQENLQRMLPGMIGAVSYGTARRAADYSLNIAGKTGSCIGQGSWLGLFASVAPVVNPKLTVIVITRGSSERGKYASGIAGQIYKSLSHRFSNGTDYLAKVPLELKPQQKVTATNSAKLDNDEGEDSDEGDVPKPETAKKPSPKKGADVSRTIFEPVIIEVKREASRPRIVQTKP